MFSLVSLVALCISDLSCLKQHEVWKAEFKKQHASPLPQKVHGVPGMGMGRDLASKGEMHLRPDFEEYCQAVHWMTLKEEAKELESGILGI